MANYKDDTKKQGIRDQDKIKGKVEECPANQDAEETEDKECA
jgi:hypothetical protein